MTGCTGVTGTWSAADGGAEDCACVGVVVREGCVDGGDGWLAMMLSRLDPAGFGGRGVDSFSRNLTNASVRLSLL